MKERVGVVVFSRHCETSRRIVTSTWQKLSNYSPGLGRRQLAPSKTECSYENRVVEGVVSITLSYLVSAVWFLVLQHCSTAVPHLVSPSHVPSPSLHIKLQISPPTPTADTPAYSHTPNTLYLILVLDR